ALPIWLVRAATLRFLGSCVRGKEISPTESQFVGSQFFLDHNRDQLARVATIPNEPKQASLHRASAASPVDMPTCSYPLWHRHRETKRSTGFSRRESAEAGGRRFDRSKCATGERRFFSRHPVTRAVRRPKSATA